MRLSAFIIFCRISCLVAYSTFGFNKLPLSWLSRLATTRDVSVAHEIDRNSNYTIFAGVKFCHPISSALRNLNISKPTPIQSASLVALTTGLSCLLHAETGSGKTLCYLLPILKRLFCNEYRPQTHRQIKAIIVLPTKELAVQVALDICNLVEGDDSIVHLCLSNEKKGLESISSPIVVGTPYKILQALQVTANTKTLLSELEYLVLDEIDRLLPVAGRYATNQDKKLIDERTNPAVELVKYLVQGHVKEDGKETPFQVVAASATVGRPLRRELSKLCSPSSPSKASPEGEKSQLHLIRPSEAEEVAASRRVGIPAGICHVAVLDSRESPELSSKLSVARGLWKGRGRGIVFVPNSADAAQALGILRFWGVSEATNLLTSLGIEAGPTEVGPGPEEDAPPAPPKGSSLRRSTAELVQRARLNGLGSSSEGAEGRPSQLFVTPVSGSRGLHLQDIDTVLILRPPRTMDEYLHMAGRTGRYGTGQSAGSGTVYTIVDLDELKRLQSWQTPLGISFQVQYV